MKTKKKLQHVYRSAVSGRFTTQRHATRHPRTTISQRIKRT